MASNENPDVNELENNDNAGGNETATGNEHSNNDLENALDQDIQAQMESDLQHQHALEMLREEASGLVESLASQLAALQHEANPPMAPSLSVTGSSLGPSSARTTTTSAATTTTSTSTSTSTSTGGGEEMEESVNTFLEFTGSQDRDRAKRYLLAADGSIEQAVNLFLSGAPLEALEAPMPRSRTTNNRNTRTFQRSALPSFLTQHLEGADGSSVAASWLFQRGRTAQEMDSALLALSGTELEEILSGGSPGSGNRSPNLQSNRILDDSQRATAHLDALRNGVWDKTPEVGAACLRSVANAEMYLDLGLAKVISDCLPMAICAGEDGIAIRFLQLLECTMRIVCDGHSAAVDHCGWWFIPARRSGSRRYARNSYTEMFLERIVPQDDIDGLQQMWLSESFDTSWRDKKYEAEMLACALNGGCSIKLLEVLIDPVNGCRANVNPDPDRIGTLSSPLIMAAKATGFEKLWKRKHPTQSLTLENHLKNKSKGKPSASTTTANTSDHDEDSDSSSSASSPSTSTNAHSDETQTETETSRIDSIMQEKNNAKEAWSKAAVEILLDAGACVDEETMAQLESMTESGRELILAEKTGTRVSERLAEKAKNLQYISEEAIEKWWQHDARKQLRSLLRAIGLTKHDSTMHRSMEVLSMLVERFRPLPNCDAVNTLGRVEYEKLMQLFQSVFTPENDDVTALVLAVKTISALLKSTKSEDSSEVLSGSGSDDEMKGTENGSETFLGIHAQFCTSLCRFGITYRLRELSQNAVQIHKSEELQQLSAEVIEKISSCIVDKLKLTEETLLGRSVALLDVCKRLREGDVTVLEHLVLMMGKGNSNDSATSQFDDEEEGIEDGRDQISDDEEDTPSSFQRKKFQSGPSSSSFLYGDEGITPFEFEQSGLPSALLEFLLATRITDPVAAQEARTARMHALLSAMPPPVVSNEEAEEEDDEEVKAGDHSLNTSKQGDIGDQEDDEEEQEGDGPSGNNRSQSSPTSGSSPGSPNSPQQEQFRFGREQRSTLGRQASLTLESVQNLATTSLESLRDTGKANENMDTSAFTASALYRLISKLQTVLAVHAAHNFPVLAHDSTASSGGVRALVNPMKIHLRRDEELDTTTSTHPESTDLVVQVLPLTPLYEFQKQVLRGVRIADRKYISFCRRLVGRKVVHRVALQPSSRDLAESGGSYSLASPAGRSPMSSPGRARMSPMRLRSPGRQISGGTVTESGTIQNPMYEYKVALVLRYDPYTGAHLLQDLGVSSNNAASSKKGTKPGPQPSRILNKKGSKQWFLMCLRDYEILERVFDSPSSDEPLEPAIEFPLIKEKENTDQGNGASTVVGTSASKFPPGSQVAVWWRGDDNLGPGWRSAVIESCETSPAGKKDSTSYSVVYDDEQLIYDDIIRVGDMVRLIDDAEELERLAQGHGGWTHDMPDYCGEVARVTSIRDTQVNTDGLGKYVYNIKALVKVPPISNAPPPPPSGSTDIATSSSSSSLDQDKRYHERNVPQRRICAVDEINRHDEKHVFAVYLLPGGHQKKVQDMEKDKDKAKKAISNQQESKEDEKQKIFKLNDRIEARYAGKSRYYKGRIARVNADGTYDIAYDDGDSERGVKPNLICHIGQGPGKVISYDFRKVFPNSAGRALFDALRREDAVLHCEYNFVTRGFEHQPDFYATFSKTLEQEGCGIFAQYQTKQQAEVLFERIQRCGQSSSRQSGSSSSRQSYKVSVGTSTGTGSSTTLSSSPSESSSRRVVRAMVDIFPDTVIPPVVERDILSAFERVKEKYGRHALQDPPPPPGHRAQVNIQPQDFFDPVSRKDDFESLDAKPNSDERWTSATILGRRIADVSIDEQNSQNDNEGEEGQSAEQKANSNSNNNNNLDESSVEGDEDSQASTKPKYLLTCVLDDGRILWDVPESRVRIAQRTSRAFPFKTKERSVENEAENGPGTPSADGTSSSYRDPSNQAEPVELSRQFTAFGQSTSYKRIRVSSFNDEDEEDLGIQTLDDDLEDDYESDGADMLPPRFEVDFMISRRGADGHEDVQSQAAASDTTAPSTLTVRADASGTNNKNNNMPVLANQDGEISMFQALFQLQNMDADVNNLRQDSGDNLRPYTEWKDEYCLKWRVRCIFPDDPDYDNISNSLRNKLPWRTPRALAYEVSKSNTLTLESFCDQLLPIVPDFGDWATRNKLDDVTNYLARKREAADSSVKTVSRSRSRSQIAVNWAAICAAYSQLCQRPLMANEGEKSPAVSPIRSPTLLKKDLLNIKMIGSEGIIDNSNDSADQKESKAESFSSSASAGLTVAVNGSQMQAIRDDDADTVHDESDILHQVKTLLDECGIEQSVAGLRDTLLLLHLLFSELVPFDESADPLAAAFGKSLPWRSDVLSDLLREQLSDPLSIATRCFPKWVAIFPREFSFLFRTKVRQIHLRSTTLGVSRAVAWLQDEVTGYKAKKRQLAHITLEISAMFRGVPDMARYEQLQELSDRLEDELKAIEQEHCIGSLHQDLVKVNRAELLHDAELLMKKHMKQRSELVVQFLDETGAGDGVTVDFYSSVSERLQQVDENKKIPMFVSANTPSSTSTSTSSPIPSSAAATSSMKVAPGSDSKNQTPKQQQQQQQQQEVVEDEAMHIVAPSGLFPQPLFPFGSVRTGPDHFNPRPLQPLFISTRSVSEGKEDATPVESREIKQDPVEHSLALAHERNNQVIQRFRFLGRLMGKAMLDGMNVPIPLSPEFFMLIQQRQRQNFDALLPISTLSLIEGTEAGGDMEEKSGHGLIRRLYELQREGDVQSIKVLLDEVDLRFVDPSQPSLEEENQDTSSSNSSTNTTSAASSAGITSGAAECGVSKNLSDAFENLAVPSQGASAAELLEYAEQASRNGMSSTQIEAALTQAGHSKMQRWKAIKGSQKTRTVIALENAEKLEKAKESSATVIASELIPGGATRRVTMSNVGEYLELILLWYLGHGVERQADAFCDGLRDVLGSDGCNALLFNFSHSEIRKMLCGKNEIVWKDEPLLGCIVPMGGYTEDSEPIQMLVKALQEMKMEERAQFLNFCTSMPRVPLSGLPQIKVYPPMMEVIVGFTVSSDLRDFKIGDKVVLAADYADYDDAVDGPLSPGQTGRVTNVEDRVRVNGWWYCSSALKLANPPPSATEAKYLEKEDWFKPNDQVRTSKSKVEISSWDPETSTLYFSSSVDVAVRRAFSSGQSVERVPNASVAEGGDVVDEQVEGESGSSSSSSSSSSSPTHPPLRIAKIVEQPQALQCRPYLRPKATTCAKTLYLPKDYDSSAHLLEVFRGAFKDMRLGGIHEN